MMVFPQPERCQMQPGDELEVTKSSTKSGLLLVELAPRKQAEIPSGGQGSALRLRNTSEKRFSLRAGCPASRDEKLDLSWCARDAVDAVVQQPATG